MTEYVTVRISGEERVRHGQTKKVLKAEFERLNAMLDSEDRRERRKAEGAAYCAEQSRTAPLRDLMPHYSDNRFRDEQTIFGAADGQELSYDYSDRLFQWYGNEKMLAASDAATRAGHAKHSADWFSAWVSHAHGYQVQVLHVVAGVNRGNGYPYFVLGHKRA